MLFENISLAIRNFMRRNTKPMSEHKARLWKNRLTIVYTIAAWNALGLVIYEMYARREIPEDANNPEMTNGK